MRTSLGKAELDRVEVCGYDLTSELVGNVTFTDMVSLMLMGTWPTPEQRRMLDAMLVILIEHGLIGPVVAARLVYSNSPEAIQGAVAASLLAAGSLHLGTSELAAKMLQHAIAARDGEDLETLAAATVERRLSNKEFVYGVGHSTHSEGDPRAQKLLGIARDSGVYGEHCELMEHISAATSAAHGKLRPVNVTGALAAIASDMGLDWRLAKSFALIGRCLGALGHLREEIEHPVADEIKGLIARNVDYQSPREAGDEPAGGGAA